MTEKESEPEQDGIRLVGNLLMFVSGCLLTYGVLVPAIKGEHALSVDGFLSLLAFLGSMALTWIITEVGFHRTILLAASGGFAIMVVRNPAEAWPNFSPAIGMGMAMLLWVLLGFLLVVFPEIDGRVVVKGGGYIGYRETHGPDGPGGE